MTAHAKPTAEQQTPPQSVSEDSRQGTKAYIPSCSSQEKTTIKSVLMLCLFFFFAVVVKLAHLGQSSFTRESRQLKKEEQNTGQVATKKCRRSCFHGNAKAYG